MFLPKSADLLSLLALLVSFPQTAIVAGEPIVQKFGDWTVTIQPGPPGSGVRDWVASPQKARIQLVSQVEIEPADAAAVNDPAELPPTPAQPAEAPPAAAPDELPVIAGCPGCEPTVDPQSLVGRYSAIYDQIPFSRAEYVANPSYRHDATMEFLFGKMRPMVIHRGTAARPYAPAQPANFPGAYSPYGFNSFYYPFYTSYGGYPSYGWLQPASLW